MPLAAERNTKLDGIRLAVVAACAQKWSGQARPVTGCEQREALRRRCGADSPRRFAP